MDLNLGHLGGRTDVEVKITTQTISGARTCTGSRLEKNTSMVSTISGQPALLLDTLTKLRGNDGRQGSTGDAGYGSDAV